MTCEKCGTELLVGMYPFCKGRPADHGATHSKTAAFPFEARHVTPDGKPITIDSLQHLRKIEKDLGVVFSAFSKSNERDLDPTPGVPRYRGDDPAMRSRYSRSKR